MLAIKKLFLIVLVGLVLFNITFITTGLAQSREQSNIQALPFCERIESIANENYKNIHQRHNENEATAKDTRSKLSEDIIDTKLAKLRLDVDKSRVEHYGQINKLTKSTEQITAVAEYRAGITLAINIRRSSIDAIRKEFRDSLGSLVATHDDIVSRSEVKFMSNIESISTQARAACANGQASPDVKIKFSADINSAKQEFVSIKINMALDKAKIQKLITTRNQALDSILATFKQTSFDLKEQFLTHYNK